MRKKGMVWNELSGWIIVLVVLIIIIVVIVGVSKELDIGILRTGG